MLNGAFLGRPVQRLHVRLSADRPTDDGTLWGAGLGVALGAGGGQFVEGGSTLTFAFTFVTLAAAVARWR